MTSRDLVYGFISAFTVIILYALAWIVNNPWLQQIIF